MTDERPTWEDPRRALQRHRLHPKRGFSQNFLVSRPTVERIAEAVAPQREELVVELGPGLGTLTAALLRAGARVHAVESDPDMRAVLAADFGGDARLEVVQGDARTVDLAALAAREGHPVAIAGNLPYAITGAILRHLVEARRSVSRAVIMVQREVRDRLLAAPGTKAYGALTVFTAAAFEVEPVMLVRPGSFHPPPKVASAVVRLVPRDVPRAQVDEEAFRKTVRAIFDARRKTIKNALGHAFDPDRVEAALQSTGLDPAVRGERLDIETMNRLADALTS